MSNHRLTTEIKRRLRKAGYKEVLARRDNSIPQYVEIRFSPAKELRGCPGKISDDDFRNFLTVLFGDSYAGERVPLPTGNILTDRPPLPPGHEGNYPRFSIQVREAEALFGWRKKEFFCSCTASYAKEKDRDECMLSH